jgi:hypothetical protein
MHKVGLERPPLGTEETGVINEWRKPPYVIKLIFYLSENIAVDFEEKIHLKAISFEVYRVFTAWRGETSERNINENNETIFIRCTFMFYESGVEEN